MKDYQKKPFEIENGTWGNGTWGNGTWGNGTWGNGTWGNVMKPAAAKEPNVIEFKRPFEVENGTWLNGTWLNGTWLNGTWLNGTWLNVTPAGAVLEQGDGFSAPDADVKGIAKERILELVKESEELTLSVEIASDKLSKR